jgi:hypothetical protein
MVKEPQNLRDGGKTPYVQTRASHCKTHVENNKAADCLQAYEHNSPYRSLRSAHTIC